MGVEAYAELSADGTYTRGPCMEYPPNWDSNNNCSSLDPRVTACSVEEDKVLFLDSVHPMAIQQQAWALGFGAQLAEHFPEIVPGASPEPSTSPASPEASSLPASPEPSLLPASPEPSTLPQPSPAAKASPSPAAPALSPSDSPQPDVSAATKVSGVLFGAFAAFALVFGFSA